jgi:hypothetical protein
MGDIVLNLETICNFETWQNNVQLIFVRTVDLNL